MDNSFSISYKNKYAFNLFMVVILIIFIFIIIFSRNNDKKESMSGGTLTQLLAKDSQDVYINSNVDKLATGNNTLFWNHPTKIMNTYMNRGSPLPTFVLPNTSLNPYPNPNQNPYALEMSNNYNDSISNKSGKKNNVLEEIKDYNNNVISNPLLSNLFLPNQINNLHELPELTVLKPRDHLYQSYYDNLLYNKNCNKDPASCGGGAGGSRLGEDFNKSTSTVPYVNISGNNFYPDSYVGSYFMEPNFDVMKPLSWMPNSNLPQNLNKMG